MLLGEIFTGIIVLAVGLILNYFASSAGEKTITLVLKIVGVILIVIGIILIIAGFLSFVIFMG